VAFVPQPVLLARGRVALKSLPQINYRCGCLQGHGQLTMAEGVRVAVGPQGLCVRQKSSRVPVGMGNVRCFVVAASQPGLQQAAVGLLWGCQPGPPVSGSRRSRRGGCKRPFGGEHGGSAQPGTCGSASRWAAVEVLTGL